MTLFVIILVLIAYVAFGLVWADRRRIWEDAVAGVLERIPETAPHFQIACFLAVLVGGILDVALWPYVEWRIRRWEHAEVARDAAILERIVSEFRALHPADQGVILKCCPGALLSALTVREERKRGKRRQHAH